MARFEHLNELQVVEDKLIHSYGVVVMVTMFFRWVASFVAVVLMIVDRTKWKPTNMRTFLLAPYLFVSLPLLIFQFLRREFGKWIALITVLLRLFLPTHFSESIEIPGATLLLIVAAPNFFVETFRDDVTMIDPVNVCIITSGYLLDKHIKASGGYKIAFTHKDKITFTICFLLLFVYPFWASFAYVISIH